MKPAEERPSIPTLHTVQAQATDFRLSAADLQAMQDDGAILLRDFFSLERFQPICQDLADRIALLEQKLGIPAETVPDLAGIQDIRRLSDRVLRLEELHPGNQSILYDAMSATPGIHSLSGDPRLQQAVQQVLSPVVNVHPRLILLMSLPKNEWHLATWHQDWYYNKGPYSTLTLYAPLQETSADNGSLLMALGEHQQGPLDHGEFTHGFNTKWRGLSNEVVAGFDRVVSTHLKVGDVLLFNSLVPHSAQLNQSEAIRFVINIRFQDLSDPTFLADGWRISENQDARYALSQKPPV